MDTERPEKIDLGRMQAYTAFKGNREKAARPAVKKTAETKPAREFTVGPLGIQSLVAVAIGIAVMGMRYMDLPVTRQALSGIKMAVSGEEEYDRAIGRLTFVSNLFAETAEVFSPTRGNIIPPIRGEVVSANTQGVVLASAAEQNVRAMAAGRVFYAGEDTVRLVHPSGYESIYKGMTPAVKAGWELEAGDTLGSVNAGAELQFTLLRDGKTVAVEELLG